MYTNLLGYFSSFYERVFGARQIHNNEEGQWKNLDIDVLEKIISDLDSKSAVFLRSVCKSWYSLITGQDVNIAPKTWLLIPNSLSTRLLVFLDMFTRDNKIYMFELPESVQGGRICGSSKGWLVFLIPKKGQLIMYNPLTGDQYELPSLSTLPNYIWSVNTSNDCETFIKQIELSSEDPSKCIVALISCHFRLACCRPDHKKWTTYDGEHGLRPFYCIYMGFCYQTLYVGISTPTRSITPLVEDCKIIADSSSMTIGNIDGNDDVYQLNVKLLPGLDDELGLAVSTVLQRQHGAVKGVTVINYLVESNKKNGNLILVRKYSDDHFLKEKIVAPAGCSYHKTRKFKALELISCKDDETGNSFVVKTVSDLGDQSVVFVGGGSTFVSRMGASTTRVRARGNCIYFIQGTTKYFSALPGKTGVFHVDNGTIEKYLPCFYLPEKHYLYWFTPNIGF